MSLFDKLKSEAQKAVQGFTGNAPQNAGGQNYPTGQGYPYGNQGYAPQGGAVPPPPPPTSPVPPPPPAPAGSGEGLYDPRMEKLISAALADGVLTEKEKQVLFKRAEMMGIDLDEFEMVLEARLYEKNQQAQAQMPPQAVAPQSNKLGDVRKCPQCGSVVESFVTRCPDCGHEFRNIGVVSSFAALTAKLEQIDRQGTNIADGLGQMFGIGTDKKAAAIKNFPVPTAKEDILEFLSMGTPMAKPALKMFAFSGASSTEEYQQAKAWRYKCEQVIIKARFAMKDDPQLLEEIEQYAKILKLKK